MNLVLFCHSLVSDWNHGSAHFLRGVVRELLSRGHDVRVLEPHDGSSRAQPFAERGARGARAVRAARPRALVRDV